MFKITGRLQEIDALKAELDSLRPLNEMQVKSLKNYFDIELTYNSNAIEGSTIDYNETKIILLDGITIGGKSTREHLETINHKEAIDYIEEIAKQETKEIKRVDVLGIHRIILNSIDTQNAGKYRAYDVYVKVSAEEKFYFPKPALVPSLMDNFFLWLKENSNMHPVLLSAEAHYRLVSIHPFIDGNGRTARLLMNLILIQNGYTPAIIKMSQRKQYIEAIEAARKKEDMTDFYNLMLDAEKESLETYLETIKNNIVWK